MLASRNCCADADVQMRSAYEPNIGHEESCVDSGVTFRMLHLSKVTGTTFRNGVSVPPTHQQGTPWRFESVAGALPPAVVCDGAARGRKGKTNQQHRNKGVT